MKSILFHFPVFYGTRLTIRQTMCLSLMLIAGTSSVLAQGTASPTIGEAISANTPVNADMAEQAVSSSSGGRWRFGASFAGFVGVKTSFTGLGTFQSPFAPAPLGGGTNYNYDDGFVRLDATGNLGGLTWNWGYNNASQYNAAGTGSISSSISNSTANGSIEDVSGGGGGFELMAYYEMGTVAWGSNEKKRPVWGVRSGLQYARLGTGNRDSATADVVRTTDTFDLGGIIPPGAPYAGSSVGPGPVIGDAPTRVTQVLTGAANISGYRDFDTDLFSLNIGPYVEFPITESLSVGVETGMALAIASGRYTHESSTTIAGVGTQTTSGSGSKTAFLPGVYLGLNLDYAITEKWSVQGGARYQFMKDFTVSAGSSEAKLTFGSAFLLSLGAAYRF